MKFEIDRLKKTGLMLAGSSKIKGKQGCIGSTEQPGSLSIFKMIM